MSGNIFAFTPEQETAINYSGTALLVAAAAGSGKTKVLVERLLDRVEKGDDVDEFLVITFTRAAAGELRERIYDEILNRIAINTQNRRLRRQSMLCRGAAIGTIHSFCAEVLREHAHLVDLSPDFRIIDEEENTTIKAAVLEKVLNEAYEKIEQNDGFRSLIDATLAGRDDKRLVQMLLDLYGKMQSNPNPHKWVQTQVEKYSLGNISDIAETTWGAYLLKTTRSKAEFWHNELQKLREEMCNHQDFESAYGSSVDVSLADSKRFLDAIGISWDEAHQYSNIQFPRAKGIKGYDDFKTLRDRCKAGLNKCTAVFAYCSAEHLEDINAIAPAIVALMQLILDFDSAYMEEKRNKGTVDFSDLEHLTASLLINPDNGEKTDIADAISKRFKEIMVDEYQDVNAVQELIFNAVSRDGRNIFMVGDVKQSIYRFRQADPTIFLERYKNAQNIEIGIDSISDATWMSVNTIGGNSPDNIPMHRMSHLLPLAHGFEATAPNSMFNVHSQTDSVRSSNTSALVLLSKNFRSQSGILDFVNYVFERIMSEEFGEINYTERERLLAGRTDNSIAETPVEFNIIDMSTLDEDDEEDSPHKIQLEARFIAKRIQELTNGTETISNSDGGKRNLRYSDIAILLRSVSGKAWQYAAALSELGIPADTPATEGFFASVEVSAALSLLEVIDNPMQDIPLAAVLRGPIYGFTADELALIRAESKGTDFYTALVKAAMSNEKCAAILKEIEDMRLIAPDMPTARFIWHVYNKTGLLGRVMAMSNGSKRRGNLILLVEYARRFEQNGYRGLFSFLVYIRELIDKGIEISSTQGAISDNVVKIMSIHKSKGLEFPVVFLADTSKQFNFQDLNKALVIHPLAGVGIKRIDRQRGIEYPTIARTAIQSILKSEMLSEELRIMYVAMTRAQEKLIISTVLKNASKEINRFSELSRGGGQQQKEMDALASPMLEDIRHMSGWLLTALDLNSETINEESFYNDAPPSTLSKEISMDFAVPAGLSMRAKLISASAVFGEDRQGDSYMKSLNNLTDSDDGELPQYGERKVQHIMDVDTGISDQLSDIAVDYLEKFREQFSFVYPYKSAQDLPSKLTVTELKNRQGSLEADEESDLAEYIKPNVPLNKRFVYDKPDFIAKKTKLTAAQQGTALHVTMQHIEYKHCGSVVTIDEELQRLVKEGFITEQQAETVDAEKIIRLFQSDIGKRMINANNTIREFRFSLMNPAKSVFEDGGDDLILIQGIVDCFFEENGELVIIDFKTDQVDMKTLEEKASIYTPQLNAYSEALERVTGKKVKDRIIYFFEIDAAVYLR